MIQQEISLLKTGAGTQMEFTVVIPVYNREEMLGDTLKCIGSQIFKDFETIVVDDGSSDNTAQIVKEAKVSNLQYVFQQNQGVSAARNKGAYLAKGKYLVFLDSDDFVTPNWLADFFQAITTSNADICICGTAFDFGRTEMSNHNSFLAGNFCIKNDLFQQVGGYDARLKYSENTELNWRVMDLNPKVAFVSNINFKYQRGGVFRPHYFQNRIEAFKVMIEKHALRFHQQPKLKQTYCQIAAVDYIRLGNYEEGRRWMWKGYFAYPAKWIPLFRAVCTLVTPVMKIVWKPVSTSVSK